jgi:hypothetical protein
MDGGFLQLKERAGIPRNADPLLWTKAQGYDRRRETRKKSEHEEGGGCRGECLNRNQPTKLL